MKYSKSLYINATRDYERGNDLGVHLVRTASLKVEAPRRHAAAGSRIHFHFCGNNLALLSYL